MKIVIATGLYPPESGGPATFAKLAEEYVTNAGHGVSVLPFVSVRQYPKLIRHCIYTWRLYRACRQVDKLVALDGVSVGLPAALVSMVRKVPFIVRLGGDYAWEQGCQRFGVTCSLDEFQSLNRRPRMVSLLRRLQTWATNQADCVIAPSNYLKQIIVGWGVSAEKVEVIYSVSAPLVKAESTNQSQYIGSPVIVSVSRLVPWKGFLGLITAVSELRGQFPDIKLLIGGDGPQLPELQKKVTELKLEGHVTLLGRLDKSELPNMASAADLFVLNTQYEGFSHVLVEFMQLGVPIITTPVGGNVELVTHEKTGLMVPYNDMVALKAAIIRFVEDEELRKQCVLNAQTRVRSLSPAASMQQFITMLETQP